MAHVCYHTKAQAEARDIGKQNKSIRVSIGKAESSICGPKAVILSVIKSKTETFLKRSSGNSYFQAAKFPDFTRQND